MKGGCQNISYCIVQGENLPNYSDCSAKISILLNSPLFLRRKEELSLMIPHAISEETFMATSENWNKRVRIEYLTTFSAFPFQGSLTGCFLSISWRFLAQVNTPGHHRGWTEAFEPSFIFQSRQKKIHISNSQCEIFSQHRVLAGAQRVAVKPRYFLATSVTPACSRLLFWSHLCDAFVLYSAVRLRGLNF